MIPLIPDIKKILYATDLSQNARYAFGYAASLGSLYEAGITILHVLEDMSPYSDSLVVNILGEEKWKQLREANSQEVVKTIKARLERFCEDVSANRPTCNFITDDIVVKIGNPAEEILRRANKEDFDLVVMGAHGHGAIEETVIGSVSRRVIRRCTKPVLVIRLPEENTVQGEKSL
ncbi:MAG: universal stress protein [Deltaproteobacteria bacterium]|nr:universal stress protein [Deltaproteobacteria bacterium]